MILVDTSAWIDFLSGNDTAAASALDQAMERSIPFGLTEIIFQELLQGVSSEEKAQELDSYLRTQRFFGPRNGLESYAQAAMLYTRCRRRGITIRSTIDCLIAQVAIDNELLLLHNDRDFRLMQDVVPELQTYPIS